MLCLGSRFIKAFKHGELSVWRCVEERVRVLKRMFSAAMKVGNVCIALNASHLLLECGESALANSMLAEV
jgi:hypothetical protein